MPTRPWFHSHVHDIINWEIKRTAQHRKEINASQKLKNPMPKHVLDRASEHLLKVQIANKFSLLARDDLVKSLHESDEPNKPLAERIKKSSLFQELGADYLAFREGRKTLAEFEKEFAAQLSKQLGKRDKKLINRLFTFYLHFMEKIYAYRDHVISLQ